MSASQNAATQAASAPLPYSPIYPVLRGQKVLVTGASSGIGRGIALAMGQAGADVLVNYRSQADEARKVADEISAGGVKALPFQADVSQEDQVLAMYRYMLEEFGRLDILISNAGLQRDAPVDQMTLADWNTVIGVNLTGPFLCSREAIRQFKRQTPQRPGAAPIGKIIFISSVHEVIPWAGHVNYAASKGGLMLLMKSIAQEVAPLGIRVNSIAPGAIRTPINTPAWNTPEALNALLQLIPYGRIGESEDIGRAAVWLASDASDYVHGTSLFVDGGMTLYPEFADGG